MTEPKVVHLDQTALKQLLIEGVVFRNGVKVDATMPIKSGYNMLKELFPIITKIDKFRKALEKTK